MNKRILICIAIIVLVFLVILFSLKKSNKSNNKENLSNNTESTTNNIYELMMNTISRNIIGMDPSEMSSDEQEFYYQYLYEESEDMEMYYEE